MMENKLIAKLKRRDVKLKRIIMHKAEAAAKEANDPLYKKFKKFRKLYLLYKLKILQKYGPKVRAAALKQLNKQK